MKMHRTICFFAACFTLQVSFALDVFVTQLVPAACGNPYGVLQATISGGVPPYTILWSNGENTEVITGLSAGSYSVEITDEVGTQATANGTVDAPASHGIGGALSYTDVHCPGALPEVRLTLRDLAQIGVPIWGPAPHTITIGGVVASSNYEVCTSCITAQIEGFDRVTFNAAPGSEQTVQWVDANGCPGTSDVVLSTEVVWPNVQVYDIQGACQGAQNGQYSYTIGPTSWRDMAWLVQKEDGTMVGTRRQLENNSVYGEKYSLAAGNYMLILITDRFGVFDDEMCADTTFFTVPDLGPGCGHVTGRVFVDGNDDCIWTNGETGVAQAIIEFSPGPFYANTDAFGGYSANLPLGTYDHAVVHPLAQQECPDPFTVAPGATTSNIGCSSPDILDVQIAMANGPARPGFEIQYAFTVRNNTLANTGSTTVNLSFDPVLSLLSASSGSTSSGNSVSWTLPGLNAYTDRSYAVRCLVPPDIALIGTTLTTTATVTTTNTDDLPANNTWTSDQLVTASFDPNVKVAQTSSRSSATTYFIDDDEWVDYTLHFQNTGSDTAFLVVVTDTLPATLDPATIRIAAASHLFNWDLSGAGILRFTFPNINLPDSNVTEARSHGFVGFRVRPRLPLLPGTVIENSANIYFDYNPPVITEPSVLVATLGTGITEQGKGVELLLTPNPTNGPVVVQLSDDRSLGGMLHIHSLDGRLVKQQRMSAARTVIDLSDLRAGAYWIELVGSDGQVVGGKLLKY